MSQGIAVMPRKPKRNDLAVKVDADVVYWARIAADFHAVPLAEYLSEVTRKALITELTKRGIVLPESFTNPKPSKG